MHDIVNYLKPIAERGAHAGVSGCYIVRSSTIYARTIGLAAGIAWPGNKDFTIPAQVLDDLLARMKQVDKIKVDPEEVIISGGRIRSAIKRIHDTPLPLPEFKGKWTKSPPGLIDELKKAQPFVGNRTWQQGIVLETGKISASNGLALIEVTFKPLKLPRQYILLPKIIDFLIAQGDPDEMLTEDNAISFRWEDGRWMWGQRMVDEMPEGIMAHIFERTGDKAPVEIDGTWKESLEDAKALSDNVVLLTSEGFTAIRESATTKINFDVNLPAKHTSKWIIKDLISVVDVATAWDPANWPSPTFFKGENVRGAIAGIAA